MCGICGIFNYSTGESVYETLLRDMTESMLHRGPDDDGVYTHNQIGLGMRRLSIIDLKSGHQPIHNENKDIWIVFNGEIYNFQNLKKELKSKGHSFYTQSDTEVIIHGYEEWGEDCFQHFNGIFGLAIWDSIKNQLVLARDHFGVKPLYYLDDGSRLLWGSEIKAILTDKSVEKSVDIGALDLYLTLRYVPSPYTMFKGIRKLAPGHRLVCDRKGCKVERYWHPKPNIDTSIKEIDYINLLQEHLAKAVQRQMISDVPIGALLSGGVDSSVIVAIMSQLTKHPVSTFTVGFKGKTTVNELDQAKTTAKLFNTSHHEIVLDSLDYCQLLQKVVWHLDEPVATTSAIPMYLVCQLARQHVKVVLTGQGADEPLAGYPRYFGERYGHYYRLLPAIFRENIVEPLTERLPRQERIKRGVRSLGIQNITDRFVREYEVFPEKWRKSLWRSEQITNTNSYPIHDKIDYWRKSIEHLHPLMQMTYIDARMSLSDDLLLYGDKMSMANSVELRVPFLDLEYMSIVESLPPSLRINGLKFKYIHKKAVRKWLPKEIINRPKKGFETPMDTWLRSESRNFVRDNLLAGNSACRLYFNDIFIEKLLDDHVSGRQDNRRHIFCLLIFELWHQTFIR
jgi:asparagine synthase (glutamine-hydrolysing)